MIKFWFKFHWNLFPGVQLTINQHCFREWLGAEQVTSHYLNKCWPSSLTHLCVTLGRRNSELTHWGRVTHICISKLTIIGSDHGLSPGWRQAMIWTNAEILLIGLLGTKFSEILIEIHTFSFKKMHLKMSSGKWRPFVSASMWSWLNCMTPGARKLMAMSCSAAALQHPALHVSKKNFTSPNFIANFQKQITSIYNPEENDRNPLGPLKFYLPRAIGTAGFVDPWEWPYLDMLQNGFECTVQLIRVHRILFAVINGNKGQALGLP